MSPEALALQLLASLFPLAVQALTDALDQGKGEAEALAAARAHMPPRIDTTVEDAARRARVAALHGLDPDSVSILAPPQLVSHANIARRLALSHVLSHEERAALTALADDADPPRLGNGG